MKTKLKHIETSLGIVNIRDNLTDTLGRKVVSIEVIPDSYVGEKKVIVSGYSNTRLIQLKTQRN